MTDADLIATLAKLLREAMADGAWKHPGQHKCRTEARRALAESDQRATKPDPHEPGAFW